MNNGHSPPAKMFFSYVYDYETLFYIGCFYFFGSSYMCCSS